jgi:hypothetical protein
MTTAIQKIAHRSVSSVFKRCHRCSSIVAPRQSNNAVDDPPRVLITGMNYIHCFNSCQVNIIHNFDTLDL